MIESIPDKSKLHPPGSVEKQYEHLENDLKEYWDKNTDGLDSNKVEDVVCSLCGTPHLPEISAVFVKHRFPYYRCTICSLVYPSPRPKPDYIEKLYTDGRFANMFYEIYLPSAEYRMDTIFKERVEEIIMPRISCGRLLDIGCSSGHFLKVAQDHGFEVYGIEPNAEMVKFSTENLKLVNIRQGYFSGDEYPREYFDVVTLWDILEHVLDPNQVLKSVREILKPGGWVFAYTPNFNSFNVFITSYDSEMFAPDIHIRHYSPKTFKKEFEKANFMVKDVVTKGLDIQHIETTLKVNSEKYPDELNNITKYGVAIQEIINASGKGDNLRIFAKKHK